MEPQLEAVFGVSDDIILSYVERPQVNQQFVLALKERRHIIVYGASKQGKSSLLNRHIAPTDLIMIGSGSSMTVIDIYKSIARQLNVRVITSVESGTNKRTTVKAEVEFKVKVPVLGEAKLNVGGDKGTEHSDKEAYQMFEYDLHHAQDLCELLKQLGCRKTIVLENFHYLKEEVQKTLAIDLRTFKDNGIRFIVLGIWRERNRLAQYNGDLLDRMVEIPVEPWEREHMTKVAQQGADKLNIQFDKKLVEALLELSFDSIGVFQEMCKEICRANGVTERQKTTKIVSDHEILKKAIDTKVRDYGERHIAALRSFVQKTKKDKSNTPGLAYYLTRAVVESKFENILHGLTRHSIEQKCRSIHPNPQKLRAADVRRLLHGLVSHQKTRTINPPIFDYDKTSRLLKIIDSTLFFYLKHARTRVLEEIKDASTEVLETLGS